MHYSLPLSPVDGHVLLLHASGNHGVIEDGFSSDFMNTSGFCLEFHYLYHGPGVARLYVMVTDESLLSHTLWEARIKDSSLQWQHRVRELPDSVFKVNLDYALHPKNPFENYSL